MKTASRALRMKFNYAFGIFARAPPSAHIASSIIAARHTLIWLKEAPAIDGRDLPRAMLINEWM